MSPARPRRPRWYVSLRSPYSWLALHDATTRYQDFWQTCELRVFFEPDASSLDAMIRAGSSFPYVPMTRAKHFYILRDVARLAAARGLRPTWPLDRDPVWEVPSLAVLAAAEQSELAGRALALRLSRARWQEGADICDPDVVAGCARDCDLDPTLAGRTDEPDRRAAGLAALQQVDRDAVFGVPFFVVGRESFWGLDRLDDAARAAAAIPVATAAPAPVSVPVPVPELAIGRESVLAADMGHAGGCG
jgi:2-hydroxychromene-2-carboxylate isomerase